jgi:hypothetical protein
MVKTISRYCPFNLIEIFSQFGLKSLRKNMGLSSDITTIKCHYINLFSCLQNEGKRQRNWTEATRISQNTHLGVLPPVEVFCPGFKGFKQFEI